MVSLPRMPKPKASRTPQQIRGDEAEALTLAYLQKNGLTQITRNFHCRAGEIDLIMQEGGTLVFVEVRQRQNRRYGGAAASVTPAKQAKLISTAQFFLQRYDRLPPCRFDVVAIEGEEIHWFKNVIQT